MKGFSVILLSFTLLSQWGCSSTPPQSEVNRFLFEYNDKEYSILSFGIRTGDPVNYLILREGESVALRARDNNLDGLLDTVLIGTITIEQANLIYSEGIAQALARGKYEKRQPLRVFTYATEEGVFSIQSFKRADQGWYNRFVIQYSSDETEITFMDQDANGVLDIPLGEEEDLDNSQSVYSTILEAGIQAGQIVPSNGSYIVKSPA